MRFKLIKTQPKAMRAGRLTATQPITHPKIGEKMRDLFARGKTNLRLAAGGLVLAALSACGGGGGGDTPAATTDAPTTVLQSSVITVDTSQASQIISASATPNGVSQIKFSPGSSVAVSLTTGSIISISQDSDSRFPLGLAGKVNSINTTSGGETIVTLSRVALADVISQSNVKANDIPLTSDNFIGVISPRAVQPGATVALGVNGLQKSMSVLGGGVILRDKSPTAIGNIVAPSSSFLGGNGTVDAGEIKLNLQIKLADMVQDASRLKPYGSGAEAKVTVSGSLKNLKITENHEFGTKAGFPTSLKSMNFKITGDMSAEAKISGGFVAELGYFSKAWAEVDEATANLLGVTAQLTGLDSKDKHGKYPIAGLVFSVPCPTSCPVAPGTTQTPVRAAKMGGVIVWIYLNANGTLTAEGSMGVRVNPGELSLGMQMPEGGKLSGIGDLKNKGNGLLLEAPFFEGYADLSARAGIAVDADFFAFGVRVANAELFLGSQFNGGVTSTPSISYGSTSLSAPWSWTGNACASAVVGGGAVLSARANIGAQVSTDWGIVSGSAGYTSPEYGGQWPNESELTVQGWHQILGLNSWYTAAASNECYPTASTEVLLLPRIARMTPVDAVAGQSRDFSITGANLPTTDHLDVTFNGCTNIVFAPGQTANLHQFTCTPTVAGTLIAVIRTLPGTTPLGTFPVEVSTGPLLCTPPQVELNGMCVTQANASINIPATSFINGLNVALSANGYGADTLMNAPPYGAAPNGAKWMINAPPGRYELFATYASGLSRPVAISFDGTTAFPNALAAVTGGFFPANRQTLSQGIVQLPTGASIMTVSRGDSFPHIQGFTLVPVPLIEGSFHVEANAPLGTLFAPPTGVTSCTFAGTGSWSNNGVTSNANGDPTFIPSVALHHPANFFSLIAKWTSGGYQFIGTSQMIPFGPGQTVSFMPNEGVSSSDVYYDNSGSLLVLYSCY